MNFSHKIKPFLLIIMCFTAFGVSAQKAAKFKVTLDAGHGGKDFGAVYNGHVEKNIALAVVLKVGKILEGMSSIEVNYTRKSDVFIELVERANIANRADANVFVSIHCNANANKEAYGTETHVMGMSKNASALAVAKRENEVIVMEKDYKETYKGFDPNSPESIFGTTLMVEENQDNSIALASKVQHRFTDDLKKKNRGVKQAPYMVLHKAYMPRVLIEMGFISNPKEGAELDSEEGQMEIAQSIANAIVSYKKDYFGSGENENEIKPSQRIPDSEKTPRQEDKPVQNTTVVAPVEKEENKPASNGEVVFKVQISASGKKLDLTPSNFKGLKNISVTTDNGTLYKYMYGETSSYDTAKENLAEAKAKGFESAYLVAFRDGKKITIQDALNKR
ncbi:N-acetylmuramoyl-L-alanine amidase family protein [Flavobacterium pallidum]|uniref:N-acetylmuramoyl-L-alanine amidase n=1 Tax=Flavobacterium pallidum TaxID=2172098 RepID=A0A2S1SJ46_9FLAO|nr:N-acetylmuramoyl-L-alanine amidase [Flavobacterium pallidum]AWI26423.1 N-acetylmuramoyl-L-alanine amidase [Flavobacterium pallidum]